MKQPYENLDDLIHRNSKAKAFFYSLSEERQHHVRQYTHSIHYDRDLRLYGELLLKGGY